MAVGSEIDSGTSAELSSGKEHYCNYYFDSINSPAFIKQIKATHFSPSTCTEVNFYQPAGAMWRPNPEQTSVERAACASLASRWILPHQGGLRENFIQSETAQAINVAIGLHGFGCAHQYDDTTEWNYFTGLAAAMGMPVLAVDWAGYNSAPDEKNVFRRNSWMTEIDHNPYLLLQLLDNSIDTFVDPLKGFSKKIPLHVNLIGHSVGARSLLVAASIDEGRALKVIENTWSQQLGRPVKFLLTALQPAFGMHKDKRIDTVSYLNSIFLRPFVNSTPHAVLIALRVWLSTLTDTYGLVNSKLYPLSLIIQKDHLSFLLAQPAAIRQAPATKILTPAQLRDLGYSIVIAMASGDGLIDNDATGRILSENSALSESNWTQYSSAVSDSMFSIQENATQKPYGLSVIRHNLGHTAELSHPDAVSKMIQLLHALQLEPTTVVP